MPSLKKYLLLPSIIRLSSRVPRNRNTAWEGYWGRIQKTGSGGDVLWDAGNDHEFASYLPALQRTLNPDLPVVDVGCGHGSFTRLLAGHFPRAFGVDVAPGAVARARDQNTDLPSVEFRTLDCTVAGAGELLATELGDCNVFVRGVFHVLDPGARIALAANLLPLVGRQGRVFLVETNFRGNALDYISRLGASPRKIPRPLKLAISGLPKPGHFGPLERLAAFDDDGWTVLEDGAVTIDAADMTTKGQPEQIPGYYAVLAPRG
ncbi:class I SAM-dependent methyltransferase [Arthrobacter sp. CAN_C5]|uniref:class I SAM-dependent methyltransferase n=1 Tax=Arthrobacter sp. CAN_C5 TaxID=2760706 RepID=UPI001AEA036D|nr:class I SAM-dependent methyltransferase [Arthrobacter sp. CAN_C5]MBP2215186.1 SAM-dependent methyltransferase [Arthrobacter sp. CAN_C5]